MVTDNGWVILCPPTEDVISQAIITVSGHPPELSPSEEIGMHKMIRFVCHIINILLAANSLDGLRNVVLCK